MDQTVTATLNTPTNQQPQSQPNSDSNLPLSRFAPGRRTEPPPGPGDRNQAAPPSATNANVLNMALTTVDINDNLDIRLLPPQPYPLTLLAMSSYVDGNLVGSGLRLCYRCLANRVTMAASRTISGLACCRWHDPLLADLSRAIKFTAHNRPSSVPPLWLETPRPRRKNAPQNGLTANQRGMLQRMT